MMERRVARRRRVCLDGAVASGLIGPIVRMRVRNLTDHGAEVVVADGRLSSNDVELAIPSRDFGTKARVVWRSMDRFGLEFVSDWAARPSDEVPDKPPTLMERLLAERAGGTD